jgi:hypothetical protein
MDKIDHLMAEKNENNKDSQKGQVTPIQIFKKNIILAKIDAAGGTFVFGQLGFI